jgi:diguanylate cyclase (GGDEF)-like protein
MLNRPSDSSPESVMRQRPGLAHNDRMSVEPSSINRSAPLALARRAWRLLYSDSQRCIATADQAFERACQRGDIAAQGWARLTRGFHLIWYATPQEAMHELVHAQRCFATWHDRAGQLMAEVGIARCGWRDGQFRASLERVLPLRDEGLSILEHDKRGMLLATIAGCYAELGDSQQAFAYMYQALHEAGRGKTLGFDVVLYCNLAHELIQLGDYHQALSYVEQGLERCSRLNNPRLFSVLSINRVICLTNLDRAAEALPDVRQLLALPAERGGRGPMNAHFESLALAALRAGELELGADLVARAQRNLDGCIVPDEYATLLVAQAELLMAHGRYADAVACLQPGPDAGCIASLRVRGLQFAALAKAHEQLGQAEPALRALRAWQALHTERALLASGARYQAAALQTELQRLKLALQSSDARRRSTEKARAELEAANLQLKDKVDEVQALQQALRQQATRDFLTGLFNRRHLDDVLPAMLALAQRERQPLAVVIIDLDHFKPVNDELGHAAGDRVLAAFGALLGEHGRRSDVACRYGGEEFCLLMPRTSAAAARRKAQALLKEWSTRCAHVVPVLPGARSFSAGVADTLVAPHGVQALLKAADDMLLQAKRQGRNRVRVHDGDACAAA